MQYALDRNSWCAIRTRSNYEKIVATLLEAKGFEQYLPLYLRRKLWSDRVSETRVPLFSGYVFCKFDAGCRTPVLNTPGVVSIVSFAGKPALISDYEIQSIQTILRSERTPEPCPFLREGLLIRVIRGPLMGLQGILIRKQSCRLIISIQMLCRSVAVEIDSDCVAPV